LSLLLVSLGAKLWLIQSFSSPLPFWDQWEEYPHAYKPWFEGRLSFTDLFAAHNEHRIFFTRIYALALLLLNGQWDGQLHMVLNAVIHCATLTGFGVLAARLLGAQSWPVIWPALAAALALPFAWENSLAGFHSQFFFMLFFSLLTLWLLGMNPAWSRRWWAGVATSIAGLFTVASGFLAAAAVFGFIALRALKQRQSWRQHLPTLIVCGAVSVAGVLLKGDVPHHQVLQAHSAADFVVSLGKTLAWPWIVLPPAALLNMFPVILVASVWLRKPAAERGEELILVTGGWVVLSAAAAAFARGAGGAHPQWRYMDSTSWVLIVNALALAWLGQQPCAKKLWVKLGFAIWVMSAITGLFLLNQRAWQIDIPERKFYQQMQLQTTRAFLATDDIRGLENRPKEQLILFEGDPARVKAGVHSARTAALLRNPDIRRWLPPPAREPMRVTQKNTNDPGFIIHGAALEKPDPATEICFGSFNQQGAVAKGDFESAPLGPSRFPYLEMEVAGQIGGLGLSLELVELASGRRISVIPKAMPGGRWQPCVVVAPEGEFKIVAHDESATGWLAFKPPRELARLSRWARWLMAAGSTLFFLGLALGTAAGVSTLRAKRRPRPEVRV